MRLVVAGIFVTGLAGMAQAATAQGNWQPQADPSPTPVYVPPPTPAAPVSAVSRPPVPKGNPALWVTMKDYPEEARKNHISGVVGFRLTIGLAGEVTGCEITASSGFASLDRGTCEVLRKNGQFRPGRDKKGNPAAGSWSSRVHWIAPDDGPPKKLDTLTTVQTFVIEVDGTATNCRATRNGIEVTEVNTPTPCANGEKFQPFTGMSGKPTRKRVTVTRTVSVSDPDN